MIRCLVWLLLCLAPLAHAAELQGTVVRVADGDTLTLRTDAGLIRVRLTEIDAPERGQPYNQVARRSLVELCMQRMARVAKAGRDQYGRALGRVYCDSLDVNAEQVRRGLAWAFTKYLTDQRIADLESDARAARVGLWRDADSVAPWAWRAAKREAGKPAAVTR